MKKMLIYNLVLILVAWVSFLNGFYITGMLLGIMCASYDIYFLKTINSWRLLFVYFIFILISFMMIRHSILKEMFNGIYFFMIIIMFGNALINEIVSNAKTNQIYLPYVVLSVTSLFSLFLALLIPDFSILPDYKNTVLVLVLIIFFPSFISITINLLSKYLKYLKPRKLYNSSVK